MVYYQGGVSAIVFHVSEFMQLYLCFHLTVELSHGLVIIQDQKSLRLRKDIKGLVQMQLVKIVNVASEEDLRKMYNQGLENLKKASVDLAKTHVILSVVLSADNSESGSNARGRLSFYDMAGCDM